MHTFRINNKQTSKGKHQSFAQQEISVMIDICICTLYGVEFQGYQLDGIMVMLYCIRHSASVTPYLIWQVNIGEILVKHRLQKPSNGVCCTTLKVRHVTSHRGPTIRRHLSHPELSTHAPTATPKASRPPPSSLRRLDQRERSEHSATFSAHVANISREQAVFVLNFCTIWSSALSIF